MSADKAPRLVALVGVDLDDKRYEPGQTITGPITKWQHDYLIREGYAVNRDKMDDDIKEAVKDDAASPHVVESRLDTREE